MEVFNKDLEEKRLNLIEIAKNESTINLIDKIKTNYLYKKYFKKINKYFVNEIEEQDLEKLEFLAIEYVHNKFRGFISSVNEDFLWAKTSKTIEDIKNKKELSSWQILLLNDLMIDTKYIKP